MLLAFSTTAAAVWFYLTILIGAVWIRRHFQMNQAVRDAVLSERDAEPLPAPAPPDAPLPRLTLLVAGKDEEPNIERCLRSILAQDYPDLQVIAINDRSADRTGEIIDRLAAHDPHLTPIHVEHVRDGWFGKNNAMREGMQRATGEFLCFTDADCTFDSPKLLAAAVRFAQRGAIDFLSVLPRLEASSFWERVVQPPAGALLVFWFPPTRVNNPKSHVAYANGAFMLMTRAAYDRLGGHEFAKATLNEDMHLARRAKSIGLRLRVIRNRDLYRVRMYTGLAQIWRGWSRIFYGCFGTFPRLLVTLLFLSVFSLSPYLSLALSPVAGADAAWIAAAAAFAIAAQQSILWRFYRLSGLAPAWALTYPLGGALCLCMILNAMRRLGRTRTTWRGTTYQGGA